MQDGTDGTGTQKTGALAAMAGQCFPLQVCRSAAGYYIGTRDADGLPFTRESSGYWPDADAAASALRRGDGVQKPQP